MTNINDAINELKTNQNQLDADGIRVGVSREALDQVLKRIELLEARDTDASRYVESVICMRTNFHGDPPYVGWRGLGLALTEALDERDKLRDAITPFVPGDEFINNGIRPWDLEPFYINAMAALTRRKAYSKGACAHLIAEKACLAALALNAFNGLVKALRMAITKADEATQKHINTQIDGIVANIEDARSRFEDAPR